MTNRFKESCTIQEIWEMSGQKFPFWLKHWGAGHSVVLVTDYWHLTALNGVYRHMVGQRYTPDKQTLLREHILVPIDDQKGWLPG
jgi:hypothetical protein